MTQSDDKTLKSQGVITPDMAVYGTDESIGNSETSVMANPGCQDTNCPDEMDDQDLQELINRILKQDQSAFTTLFKAVSVRVHSLAFRITDSLQLAEEVTEDTFFQVWRQAPRFDPSRGTVKAWILTIARSRALDARRSIPPFDALLESETISKRDGQNHDETPDLLSAVERNQLLYRALEDLEFLPRQLIALSFFRGLTHEEIADHTLLPIGTVKITFTQGSDPFTRNTLNLFVTILIKL